MCTYHMYYSTRKVVCVYTGWNHYGLCCEKAPGSGDCTIWAWVVQYKLTCIEKSHTYSDDSYTWTATQFVQLSCKTSAFVQQSKLHIYFFQAICTFGTTLPHILCTWEANLQSASCMLLPMNCLRVLVPGCWWNGEAPLLLRVSFEAKRTNQTANSCTEVLSSTWSHVLPCYHTFIVLNKDNGLTASSCLAQFSGTFTTFQEHTEAFREDMEKLVPTLLRSSFSILLFSGPCQKALPMTRNVNQILDTVAPNTTCTRVPIWPNKEVKLPIFPLVAIISPERWPDFNICVAISRKMSKGSKLSTSFPSCHCIMPSTPWPLGTTSKRRLSPRPFFAPR